MAEFIMNLRKIIGKIPIILCTASVIVIDAEGKILLQQRSDNQLWGIPGGCLDLGETVEAAAIREVWEETGILVEQLTLFKVYSGEEQHHFYPNGDEAYFNNTVFIAKNPMGKISLADAESKDVAFFALDNLPDAISVAMRKIITDYTKYSNSSS